MKWKYFQKQSVGAWCFLDSEDDRLAFWYRTTRQAAVANRHQPMGGELGSLSGRGTEKKPQQGFLRMSEMQPGQDAPKAQGAGHEVEEDGREAQVPGP